MIKDIIDANKSVDTTEIKLHKLKNIFPNTKSN